MVSGVTVAGTLAEPATGLLVTDIPVIDAVNNFAAARTMGGNIRREVMSAIWRDGALTFNNNVLPSMAVWNKR